MLNFIGYSFRDGMDISLFLHLGTLMATLSFFHKEIISLISLISILGIALGVMALIVVISVMNGFDRELREKFVGLNPHILIQKQGRIDNPEELLATLNDT